MASKMPYMQFYVNDFDNDTKGISSLAVGVWIRVLMNMHRDGVGSITGTLEKLAQMTRCTVDELQSGITELTREKIAELQVGGVCVTAKNDDFTIPCHADVTLICRRLSREKKARELASIRKQKERMSRSCHAVGHASVTPQSRLCHGTHAPKDTESESETEYKKEKQKKKISFVGVAFFSEKFKTEKFIEAWQGWETFRREKRCALTESTAKKQLAMLADFEENEAIAILDKSITNGWQGLFPESVKKAENEELSAIEKIERGIQI